MTGDGVEGVPRMERRGEEAGVAFDDRRAEEDLAGGPRVEERQAIQGLFEGQVCARRSRGGADYVGRGAGLESDIPERSSLEVRKQLGHELLTLCRLDRNDLVLPESAKAPGVRSEQRPSDGELVSHIRDDLHERRVATKSAEGTALARE